MANDVASTIIKIAKEIEESEDVSEILLSVVPVREPRSFYSYSFTITKTRGYVKILYPEKELSFKLLTSISFHEFRVFSDVIWTNLITDCLYDTKQKEPGMEHMCIGMQLKKKLDTPHMFVTANTSYSKFIHEKKSGCIDPVLLNLYVSCSPAMSIV